MKIPNIIPKEGDDYTTGCLLNYNYLKEYYKMIAINLSKQQVLDADPKALQEINFKGNLERVGHKNTIVFSIIEEVKNSFKVFQKEL